MISFADRGHRANYAEARLHQRAIPPFVIDLLERFGRHYRMRGADVVVLGKDGRARAVRYLGRAAAHYRHYLDTYMVVSDDGSVITAGYRTRRLQNR